MSNASAMSLSKKINKDLTDAVKARDSVRVSCLRMLKSSLKNREKEAGRELKDEEVQAIVSSSIRKGKESVMEFRKGGREDLATKEEQEINIFYEYLPRQLTPDEVEKSVREVISDLSAESPKDLGRVMKTAMARMAGQAQGKEVGEIARKLLG